MSDEKPYEFIKCDSDEMRGTFFAGYKPQVNAGLGILYQILQDLEEETNPNYKVLIFGMPGTGKSTYPKALMKGLYECKETNGLSSRVKNESKVQGLSFSFFQVKCLGLLTSYTDLTSLKTVLSVLKEDIESNTPAVVVFDELDAFSPEKREQSEYLSYWTMNFVKNELSGLAIFGIVNYPDKLDPAVYRKFEHLFYFELPDENTVAEILNHFSIPNYQDIAGELCSQPVDTGELLSGCKAVIKFKGGGISTNLRNMNTKDLADFIGDYLKMPWKKVRDYKMDYAYYIKKAVNHMKFWEERRNLLAAKATR